MREIVTFNSYEDSSKKYIDDLKYIISRDIKFKDKPPVLMLSGGVDSMLLGCILKEFYGLKDSITVGCVKDTHDVKVSQDTAEKLGINNNLVLTTLEEVLDNVFLCKGKNIKSLFNMVYYLTFKLCLEKVNVKGLDLVQGDGADTLLGSLQVFMYKDTPHYMKKYNVDKDTAKTMIEQQYYADAIDPTKDAKKGSGHLFVEIAQELGANPIMAFKHPDILRWVNDVPYSFARPDKKTLPKEVIKYLGYNPENVKRTIMEKGTGIYEIVGERVMQMTGKTNPNSAVKMIVNSGAQLPI